MDYTKVAVRTLDGALVIRDAKAKSDGTKIEVIGKLEAAVTLKVKQSYKITGETGLKEKVEYVGSSGAGLFNFKIE